MSAFRLLAFGGFSALSGSTFAYYFHQLNGDASAVDCKSFQYYEGRESSPQFKQKNWDYNWDLLEPKKDTELSNEKTETSTDNKSNVAGVNKKAKPTATRHVILIRHGQYVYSKDGDHQRILTDLGRQQASLTGERLKSLGIKFDQVVISTMTRAQETGKIIGECLPDVEQNHCSLLREGFPYLYEPSSQTIDMQMRFFTDNPRIEGAFRKYIQRAGPEQKEDSYDLVVCHGNVIRYFVCRALQFPPEGWLRMSIAHCGITWISIRPSGKVSVTGVGHSGHLPSNLVTYS